jgi:NitT/TauT family transport system substrate-binding protein
MAMRAVRWARLPLLLGIVLWAGAISHAESLKVAYVSQSGDQAPLWIAAAAGLFKKQNLDVQMIYIPGGSVLTQAMLSGDVGMASMAPPAALGAWAKGADLTLVAVGINRLLHVVMSSPQIKRPEDLKGKRVGISRFGSLTDLAMREALRRYQLQPEKDVALVQVGGVGERLTALKAGALDAVLLAPDQRFQAEKMGFHAVIELSKLGIEYPLNGIVARGQFLRTNRETAKRFLKAWSEGIKILRTDKNLSAKVLGEYLRVDDPEVLAKSYETYRPVFRFPPVPDRKALEFAHERMAETSPELKQRNPAAFIDDSLIAELTSEGFFK